MKASSIVSRATTSASGSSASEGISASSSSGIGCSHATSPFALGWRGRFSSASRQALVAIRYSQARSDARPA